jgi:hypothetical protein
MEQATVAAENRTHEEVADFGGGNDAGRHGRLPLVRIVVGTAANGAGLWCAGLQSLLRSLCTLAGKSLLHSQ